MNGFIKSYYKLGEIALDLFLLNLYWIIFTMLGGIIFGIIPATVSMYTCIREKTIKGSYKTTSWSLFKNTYKTEFFKSNKLLFLLLIWAFIYIDTKLLEVKHLGLLTTVVSVFLIILSILIVLVLMNLFPIYVHFEGNIREYLKRSIVMLIAKPKETIMSTSLLILVFSIYYTFPGLIPVFGGTIYVFFSMRFIFVRILDYDIKSDYLNGIWVSDK